MNALNGKNTFKDGFKINGKQKIKMLAMSEYVILQNYKRMIKLPFMIYVDFESILVPEDNGKQNRNESYKKQISKARCLLVMAIN